MRDFSARRYSGSGGARVTYFCTFGVRYFSVNPGLLPEFFINACTPSVLSGGRAAHRCDYKIKSVLRKLECLRINNLLDDVTAFRIRFGHDQRADGEAAQGIADGKRRFCGILSTRERQRIRSALTLGIQVDPADLVLLAFTDPSECEVLQFSGVPKIHFFLNPLSICINRRYAKLKCIGYLTSRVATPD